MSNLEWVAVPLGSLAGFAVAALLIELTPGPNMGYLAIISAQQGRRAGFIVVAGVAVGLAFYLFLSAFGIAQGLLAHRAIYQTLRWSGVAYMVWLAIEAVLPDENSHSAEATTLDDRSLFGRGLLANILNVKAAVFYVAILPNFLAPQLSGLTAQALQLGSLHILIATLVHSAIVIAATASASLIRPQSTRFKWLYAVGLICVAGWLAWSTKAG